MPDRSDLLEVVNNQGHRLNAVAQVHIVGPNCVEILRNVLLDVPDKALQASALSQTTEVILQVQ